MNALYDFYKSIAADINTVYNVNYNVITLKI